MVSPHPWFRLHSQMANSERLRELYTVQGREPVRINAQDAADRGIEDGDLVELYNDRASVLGIVDVTERVPAGIIHSYGCSAKYDPLVPGKAGTTDKAGCGNLLTSSRMVSKHAPGMTSNSCLCEVRKWEG